MTADSTVNTPDRIPSRTALCIEFSLPPGTYATMLLRELTKQSMEKQFHSGMTADNAESGTASTSSVAAGDDSKPSA